MVALISVCLLNSFNLEAVPVVPASVRGPVVLDRARHSLRIGDRELDLSKHIGKSQWQWQWLSWRADDSGIAVLCNHQRAVVIGLRERRIRSSTPALAAFVSDGKVGTVTDHRTGRFKVVQGAKSYLGPPGERLAAISSNGRFFLTIGVNGETKLNRFTNGLVRGYIGTIPSLGEDMALGTLEPLASGRFLVSTLDGSANQWLMELRREREGWVRRPLNVHLWGDRFLPVSFRTLTLARGSGWFVQEPNVLIGKGGSLEVRGTSGDRIQIVASKRAARFRGLDSAR